MATSSASDPLAGRTVAVLLSTMRSGSTLLKALLAQAPDICDLPETDFQKFRGPDAASRLAALSRERILLLKRPGWFNDIGRYPRMPDAPVVKRIVLVRDAYANLLSVRKMMFRHVGWLQRSGIGNRFIVSRYWTGTNTRLQQVAREDPANTILVRYEDVLANPIARTAEIFSFLGSSQREGLDSYGRPDDYEWRWGRDDGGTRIKSLTVQPPREITYADRKLFGAIKNCAATQSLRRELGYPDLPAL